MPTPILVESFATSDIEPTYQATPAHLAQQALQVVTPSATESPTLAHGRPVDPVAFRSMAAEPWGMYRVVVDNLDVTYFDDTATKIGSYQLTEPYGWGDASFEFPQITSLMVDQWGTGDLSWFDIGKAVRLVQVDADLNSVRLIWKGFIAAVEPSATGTVVTCGGAGSGRMALRDKHPELFTQTQDIGWWLYKGMAACGLYIIPRLGPTTGISLDTRGQSGTYLSYIDYLLSMWQTLAGAQGTVMPAGNTGWTADLKDTTTVDYTTWQGHGVVLQVTRDLSEEYTTVYGSGQRSDGQIWSNIKVPNLIQGDVPSFPGSLSLGDSGSDVRVLTSALTGRGYLDLEDGGDDFTAAVEDAVEALQEDRGLSVTGVVNSATWTAVFTIDGDFTLRQDHIAPLAQLSAVKKWLHTSSGAIASANPNFDPARIEVDWTVDHGTGVRKSRARKWSRARLAKMQSGKNWAGTLTLTADVAAGEALSSDALTEVSRLDILPGKNILVRDFDGDTLFHVATVDVDNDLRVTLGVDTKARDALTLGQIIERNRASRQHPARQWLREHRGTDAHKGVVQFTEIGGLIFDTITCPGGEWTVFPVVAGQSGSVNRIKLHTTSAETTFVVAVTAKKTTPAYWAHKIGNPFVDTDHAKWGNSKIRDDIDDGRALLYAAGTPEEPCGFWPGRLTDPVTGTATGAIITGKHLDDGGWDYHTFDQPVLWVAIYPDDDTTLEPQRIFWEVLEGGVN